MRKPYQSPGQDEKLILLYCPGLGLNSRPPAHRSFKHGHTYDIRVMHTYDNLPGLLLKIKGSKRKAAFSGFHHCEIFGKFSFLVQQYTALNVDAVPGQSTWWRC